MRLKFTGDLSDADPPGEYARYQPESGSFHVTLDGVDAECTYHGAADVAIVPPTLGGPGLLRATGRRRTVLPVPAGGARFMTTLTNALPSSSSTLTGEANRVLGNVTFEWACSLGPEA